MLDVLITGAGPAGSIAALLLARAGSRVLIVDRETFPRDKLCGDTLNPGAVALLASLGLTGGPLPHALRLHGMRVTGPRASVAARYDDPLVGLSIQRRDLDAWLLEQAIRAGAHFEPGLIARALLTDEIAGARLVRGVVLTRRGNSTPLRMPATLTLAADGRRSTLARAAGLLRPTRAPRRWAYGTYVDGVEGTADIGEMHIRSGWYMGIAPVTGGLVNVCVVTGRQTGRIEPLELIRQAIHRDPLLAARFSGTRFDRPVRVLGPLAADVRRPGIRGLMLVGDAGGFVDPMTGDGLHLAMRSAVLGANEALRTLDTGDFDGAIERLIESRQAAFGGKLRFNRFVRRLVDSPAALNAASLGARIWPGLVARAVRYAGDAA